MTLGLWLTLLTACGGVHRYPDGTGIEGQLEREVVALQLRVKDLEATLDGATVANPSNPLAAELHQVFADSGVLVTPVDGGARLNVPAMVVFGDPASLRIRDEAAIVFDLLATAIRKHEELEVHVTGHTSDRLVPRKRGVAAPTPMQITLDQARTFVEHLSSEYDVPLARFYIAGRGPFSPIESNDLAVGQDANERLEILLISPRE
jgi:chemotaxis protein MotB